MWSEPRVPWSAFSGGGALASSRAGQFDALRGVPCRTPVSRVYHRLHARFLRLAGGEAEAAQEAALTMLLQPGLRMLDAGCGPATVARRLLALEGGLQLTLLDKDPWMLAQCRDLKATQVGGSLTKLPFRDCSFDVVFAFWSIETLADPGTGLRELVRVTRPGGWIAVTFCARCPGIDWVDRCFQIAISLRRSGRMLDPGAVQTALAEAGVAGIRHLHCRGPARAIIGQKGSDCH